MNDAIEKISEWAESGKSINMPAWDELPEIPLYMDQVMLYLTDKLQFFERDSDSSLLTSSMINNYVKNDVLPHPEKKKYGKEHLSGLIAICMLKQVLSMQDIKTLFGGRQPDAELYELFREAHTGAVRQTCKDLSESCAAEENLRTTALRLAAEANAKRAAAERILCELAEKEQKKDTKEKGASAK